MTNQEDLQEYSNYIRRLRQQSLDAGIDEEEFERMYQETLESVTVNNQTSNRRRERYWKYKISLIIIICLYIVYSVIYSILNNLQEYIYPGLRLLRQLSIPIISLFPSLTELYHETCLFHNPFFTVADMDCWPCSTVNDIRRVYNHIPLIHPSSAPFIYETDQQKIELQMLENLYKTNVNIFDKEASTVLVNNEHHINIGEMLKSTKEPGQKNFYTWKINNMNVGRVLRSIILKPKIVPKFGQSTERFIIIDSSGESFHIPDTECHNAFLISLSGIRTINLIPAEECKHQCKSLKVELEESHLIWYNWWYWRPVVQATFSNNTFIAHLGSYC